MSTSYYDFSGHLVARSPSTTASLTATASGQTLTGTGANERLSDVSGGDVLVGGGGDDSFVVHDASTKLFEAPSGGVDSVLAYKDVALPANVEILGVGGSLTVGTGNSAGNLLIAWATRDRLEGGGATTCWSPPPRGRPPSTSHRTAATTWSTASTRPGRRTTG